ncbi:unnamed protein product [Cochlearia groenlandica]
MPLTRYQARNEYGLADPDLYSSADKDDPEALLEAVAMAGLVGLLRQLGDLAEFAAEMFHDLHEEVMATASRSHGLAARVQQLEAEMPFVEKALLCQTDHSPFFSHKGMEWHPNLQTEQSVVTRGDLPRCVMDSYEECRGPPRLFLLDKFDISGAGACLKRYTDPSFVRNETSSYEASWDDIQREKKSQKAKRRTRNGVTPENALTSHAKLHELFLEEHLETRLSDPARAVKLKTRKLDGYSLISKTGESYMGKFVQTSFDSETNTPNHPALLTWNNDNARDVVANISTLDAPKKSHGESRAEVSLPNEQENVGFIEKDIETVPESTQSKFHRTSITKGSQTNLNGKLEFLQHRSYSEDLTSEAENYVDAPATMESETETDDECSKPKNRSGAVEDVNNHTYSDVDEEKAEEPSQFSFFNSVGNTPVSENGQNSFGKRSTSFSYSDTASASVDDQSDGEKSSGRLPSTSSIKSELVSSTSHATSETNKASYDLKGQESVSSSNGDSQTLFNLNDTCSSPMKVSQNDESCSLTIQSSPPEVVQTSPKLVGLAVVKGSSGGSEVDPISSSRSRASSETSSISLISEGSRYDTTVEKNCMVDHSSSLLNGEASSQVFVDSQKGKELPVADDDVETNSTVACSKALVNSGSDAKSRDSSSQTVELLPCSAETGMEVSPEMPAKVCGHDTVDESCLDTLDDETEFVTVTNAVAGVDSQNSVAEVDSQSSVAEISDKQSCAFGTTADVSVSDSHEDTTLENGMSVPAEVHSKQSSEHNSGGEKSVGDASPTCSNRDEHISDLPAEFHEDNAAANFVPNVELAVSDNQSETSSDDVTLSSTSLVGSLPWISKNVSQSSSDFGKIHHDTGEICNETVVESNETLPAENIIESEKQMQDSTLEVASEGLDTPLYNNDLMSCESSSPMNSPDRSDRDTEIKSPCKSILEDNYVDPSPENNLDFLESVTSEELVKVQTPYASHAFADEELKQSSVSTGLEFESQSAGIELNSPKQELNLGPTFPSFGLIPETTSPSQEDMPPLPPLPPMQWRIGKAQHSFFPTFMGESAETSSSALSAAQPPFGSSSNIQIGSKPSELAVSVSSGSDILEQLPEKSMNDAAEKPSQSSTQLQTIGTDLSSQYDGFSFQSTQSVDLSAKLPAMPNQKLIDDIGPEANNLSADHASQNHEQLPGDTSAKYKYFEDDKDEHSSQSPKDQYDCPETKTLTPVQSTYVEDKVHSVCDASNAEIAEPSNPSDQKMIPAPFGDAMWHVSAFAVSPTLDTDNQEKVPVVKLPRPRSPLVDAVAAHDRRTMKKVSERVQPPIKSVQDDKDSLLAQIRNKSINLKPAVSTRPSIQTGPKTNFRVAAILEKANTIRQAMAGSDEDEDSDSWSDS